MPCSTPRPGRSHEQTWPSRHRNALSQSVAANDLWCADYKGEFRLGNRSWCYSLTVTDHASRFVLLCEAMQTIREEHALTVELSPLELSHPWSGLRSGRLTCPAEDRDRT
jgi:transposase InsO family protein